MSKSSIRNKAKSIISSLFTTMGLFTQNTTEVIFICTTQERERSKKDLMAREMKKTQPGSAVGQQEVTPCHAALTR